MYTIAVQIHGQNQLKRVNPDLITSVRRQLISCAEVQGASMREGGDSTWLFPFERTDSTDRRGVVEAVLQFKQTLESRSTELLGWLVLVDFLDGRIEEAETRMQETLAPIYHDDVAVVGERAFGLLENHLTLEEMYAGNTLLRRIVGRHANAPAMQVSLMDLASSDETVDKLVSLLGAEGEGDTGVLLISADPTVRQRISLATQEVLLPSDPLSRGLSAEYAGDEPLSSIATIFDPLSVQQTQYALSPTEYGAWVTARAAVSFLTDPRCDTVPQNLETDLSLGLSLFLTAYGRRMAEYSATPLVVCHDIDCWDRASVDMLVRAVARTVESLRPSVLCTGTHAVGGLSQFLDQRVRAGGLSVSRLRDYLAESGLIGGEGAVNWQRVARVTQGRPVATIHYLCDPAHWDSLDEERIAEVSAEELAWRTIRRQDSDVREVLLALHYVSPIVSRDEVASLLSSLGLDTVRIPAIISQLEHVGLLYGQQRIRPVFESLRRRLEIDLGSAAGSVRERMGAALLAAVRERRVRLTVQVLHVLAECGADATAPELYHGLVSRRIDRHEFAVAHSLLYDSPALPPGVSSTGKMQKVFAANRLRLALLQQNRQAATRAAAALESGGSVPGPVAGDTTLYRARHALAADEMDHGVALLKQSIVDYQERDDEVGLARANLDYGMLKLAQEDLHGAHDYFRMAAMAADGTESTVEKLRAARLLISTEFISGNISRVIELASALQGDAIDAGAHDTELFALFALGRAAFELGRHDDADTLFGQSRTLARLYGMRSAEAVMQRWLARNLVYSGRYDRAIEFLVNAPECAETQFFLAEALLRRGDQTETLHALARVRQLDAPTTLSYESISWATGFAPLEDLAIGVYRGHRVLWSLSAAFEGYVFAQTGRVEDGLNQLYKLTRDLDMSDLDPNNRIYFYLYSCMIPESGDLKLEDPGTVLGKAVRYLQQRTSRMEQYNDKTDYLRKNYWNALLMSRAQVHNLV